MNTPLGPNLPAWKRSIRLRGGYGYGFCGVREGTVCKPCGVARTRYTPRVDAGKGTAYAVERREWRSLRPGGNKAPEPAPQSDRAPLATWHGANLRLMAGSAHLPAE